MKPAWTPPTPTAPYREPDVPPKERKTPWWVEWPPFLLHPWVLIGMVTIGAAYWMDKHRPPPPIPETVTIRSTNCSCTCEVTR